MEKFIFVECMISWKFNGKLCTLQVLKVRIQGKFWIHWMYEFFKIQWTIVFIRCTDVSNLWKNSNSLNVLFHENLMENCVD